MGRGGGVKRRSKMIRTLAAAAILALAAVTPIQPASAQNNTLLGGVLGGVVGGTIGGAVTGGKTGGIIAGTVIGATTGAIIASEADRRAGGFYWWHRKCYYRNPNGSWVRVSRRYCY
jgi:outer membrane lipoprotein SlyB